VRRIWCRDKLIYNSGSDDIETVIASNQSAKSWKVYLGTDDQMPDARYEAQYGVGNVSAHRGLAYIAFYDFALKDYGDTLEGAQFKVEIVKSGHAVNIIIDIDPATFDNFSVRSVFGPLANQYGLSLLDTAKSIASDGVASYTTREFKLGSLNGESAPIVITDISLSATPRAMRSSDGRRWVQYVSNDPFVSAVYMKSDDDLSLRNSSNAYAQDMILHSVTGGGVLPDQYNFFFSFSTLGGENQPLTDIAYAATFKGLSTPAGIIRNLNQSTGWNISTAGDEPYEWNVSGVSDSSAKTFNVRIYDAALNVPVFSFSGSLPDTWPRNNSGRQQISTVACYLVDRVAYIVCKDRTNSSLFRYAAVDSTGTIFEYSFTTPTAAGENLIAIWPYDANQAIIQTTNRIVQWRRHSAGGSPVSSIIQAECALSGLIGLQ